MDRTTTAAGPREWLRDKTGVPGAFDAMAHRYDLMVGLNPGYTRHLRAAAEALLDQLPAGLTAPLLFDVGCGTGRSTEQLVSAARRRGLHPRIIAVDPSSGMLDQARTRLPSGVEFVHATLAELTERGLPAADGVMGCYLARNLPDLPDGLTQLHGLLRPGGALVLEDYSLVEDPAARSRFARVNRHIIRPLAAGVGAGVEIFDYLHGSVDTFASPERLAQLLGDAGFVDVATRTVPGWQRGILHLFRARRGE